MAYESILFDVADGAARLTLNRPDRLNSFTLAMHNEVAGAISRIESDPGVRVLLVTGAGRGFCAGQDLSDPAIAPGGDLGVALETSYNPLIR
jgi:2-(1,2-epoxy-1,2-dihydrophenyl)acetyl-CoA isomerase